ncbi:amino acid permease-domain-containing protein [Pelagophyceae sp. CCMP2097]|nr:amino acid permease-domain-containing protein [Pelagophyceae sp. CCMP2097]
MCVRASAFVPREILGGLGAPEPRQAAMPFASALRRRKTLSQFAAEALEEQEESKDSLQLGLFDLLCIGIGGTVGSGVFVLTGEVLPVAGAASALCWLFGGFVCLLSALSYMELSTVLQTRGSTYAFASYALGEVAAVAGAASLTLEYGLSGAGVARSWSAKLQGLVGGSWMYSSLRGDAVDVGGGGFFFDYAALCIQVACVVVVAGGASVSTKVINVFTVAKVALVVFMIVAGFYAGSASTFAATPFLEKGVTGITTGTSLVFFGFIGFDEVVCMAARAKNPKKAMPRAIAGTLAGAAALSFLAQLSLSWLYRADDGFSGASFERGFHQRGLGAAKWLTEVGEVVLLPLVVLLSFLPQPELVAAMGHDGLVPRAFARRTRVNGADVFGFGCFWTGAALSLVALVVPFNVLWNTINLGVLFGFNLTNASLISVRAGNGGALRDGKADTSLAALCCVWLPAAAYVLWKGFAAPRLDGRAGRRDDVGYACLAVGACLAAQAYGSLRFLARRCKAVDDDDAGFRAPFVPWLPGAAIFLNFALMAQYSAAEHVYFLGTRPESWSPGRATRQTELPRGRPQHSRF